MSSETEIVVLVDFLQFFKPTLLESKQMLLFFVLLLLIINLF